MFFMRDLFVRVSVRKCKVYLTSALSLSCPSPATLTVACHLKFSREIVYKGQTSGQTRLNSLKLFSNVFRVSSDDHGRLVMEEKKRRRHSSYGRPRTSLQEKLEVRDLKNDCSCLQSNLILMTWRPYFFLLPLK